VSRKSAPDRANRTRPRPAMATENRRDSKKESSSSGCFVWRSHITKVKTITAAPAIAAMIVGRSSPHGRLDDSHSNRATPGANIRHRSRRPFGVRIERVGHDHHRGHARRAAMGTLIKTPSPTSSGPAATLRQPGRWPAQSARADHRPMPGPIDRLGEDVGQDREGRGMIAAAPMPMKALAAISWSGLLEKADVPSRRRRWPGRR